MRVQLAQTLRRVLATSTAVAMASLTACSNDPPASPPQPSYTPTGQSSSVRSATPTARGSASPSDAARNDFAELPLRRSINASSLAVNIEYDTRLPIEDWEPRVPKPVKVTLTASNRRKRNQNVYLVKTTAELTAAGDNGFVDRPEAVVDISNLVPGFIVTTPNTYNQVFNLPAVDESATVLTIDLTYELVTQVSAEREFGDYSKQVATDTIVVPLAR